MSADSMTPAAQRLLRQYSKHLLREDSYLLLNKKKSDYELFHTRNAKRALARIDGVHIAEWQRADLLELSTETKDEVAVLSPAGRAWLRRAAASHSPFMAQHQQRGKSKELEASAADCNVAQTPLDWLRTRSQKTKGKTKMAISDIEFDAGEKLRGDFERAQLSSKVGMDWSRPVFVDGNSGRDDIADHVLDARKRVREALVYAGPGLGDLLLSVCCCLQGLEESEAVYQLPRRSGKVMLKLALIRLSVFYGLQSEDNAAASFRMR